MIDKEYRGTITINYKSEQWFGHLELKTKFTLMQGFSATGKTTVIRHLNHNKTEVEVSNGYRCVPLAIPQRMKTESVRNLLDALSEGNPTVFYMDEDEYENISIDMQKVLATSPYMFLAAYRSPWKKIPYGVDSFKKVCCKKLGSRSAFYYLEDLFPRFNVLPKTFSKVFTEDKMSGLAFFRLLIGNDKLCNPVCYYDRVKGCANPDKSGGKANVSYTIMDPNNKYSIIIADRLGMGSEILECISLLEINPTVTLYLIDSFEKMVLDSEFIQSAILKYPEYSEYIEPAPLLEYDYEDYYTKKLKGLFLGTLIEGPEYKGPRYTGPLDNGASSYGKSELPECLRVKCCKVHRKPCDFFNSGSIDDPVLNKLQLITPKGLFELLVSKRAEIANLVGSKPVSEDEVIDKHSEDFTTHTIFSKGG